MSKFLLFSKINSKKPVESRAKKWHFQIKGNYLKINIACLCLLGILFLAYIGLATNTANIGYELSKMQDRIETIESSNRELELAAENLQSMDHIKSLKENLNLEEAQNVAYLGESSAVALSE